jgi:phospholipid/cholesterol/gamma-HCH transport system substrate-binding protein
MNPRRRGSLASSPLLIGALTTLIVVVAVYLSYNANNGLPFVPTYNIKVVLPEGAGLQASNVVRVGGSRVGIINALHVHESQRTGKITAIADLKLEKSVQPLPVDTKAIVQSLSSIGLKYLQLEKGTSRQTIKPGGTIPLSQVREPVNIEEFFNMFNHPTRTASKVNLASFGNGLAGRGLGLNQVFHELRPLVTNAIPVLRNLASPATDLHGFFAALGRYNAQAAPVAGPQAAFYRELDKFFTDWAGVAPFIEKATVGGPPSLEQAIHSLPFEKPFNEKQTEFVRLLRPSAKLLVSLAPPLGHAIAVGAVNLREATKLNSALASSNVALREFTENPIVPLALEDFTETLQLGNPVLAGLAPTQSVCNYFTLAFRNLASLQSENVGIGTLSRAAIVLNPNGPNNEGLPSSGPAIGPSIEHSFGSSAIIDNNHLHANPYPNVSGPGQPAGLCEAGNESYAVGKAVVGHAPSSAKAREITSREVSLFGEKYPAQTLRDLGGSTATPVKHSKKTAKKKSKKKGAGR